MTDTPPEPSCCPPRPVGDLPAVASEAGEAALGSLAKALGHPARVRIMRVLLSRDACVCGEIVAALPLAQATVSQHLKVLRESGLVRGQIDGPRTCYCVDRARLGALHALLGDLIDTTPGQTTPESTEITA